MGNNYSNMFDVPIVAHINVWPFSSITFCHIINLIHPFNYVRVQHVHPHLENSPVSRCYSPFAIWKISFYDDFLARRFESGIVLHPEGALTGGNKRRFALEIQFCLEITHYSSYRLPPSRPLLQPS